MRKLLVIVAAIIATMGLTATAVAHIGTDLDHLQENTARLSAADRALFQAERDLSAAEDRVETTREATDDAYKAYFGAEVADRDDEVLLGALLAWYNAVGLLEDAQTEQAVAQKDYDRISREIINDHHGWQHESAHQHKPAYG